jgi:hypothetical protein
MDRSSSPNGEPAYTSKSTPYETRASQDDIISPNLADQPDIPIKTESPLYSPLQGSEIRLVSIQRARPDGILRCNLFHAPLTENLEFHALSYTWGDLNHKQTITVNDQPFQVNQNLYDFLDQAWKMADLSTRGEEILVEPSVDDLFRRECLSIYGEEISLAPFTEALHWWIDAMCINQRDDHERNEQVPRMGKLYSSASQVWVWLGLSQTMSFKDPDFVALKLALSRQFAKQPLDTDERDGKPVTLASQLNKLALDIFAQVVARQVLERMQEDFRNSSRPNITNPAIPEFQVIVEAIKAGISENRIREEACFPRISGGGEQALPILPEDSDDMLGELLMLLGCLVANPWFKRTWIIQEFVLSRNPPIALIGDYPFYCFCLFGLSRRMFHKSSTMSNTIRIRYSMIEHDLFKLSNLEGAYMERRESKEPFELRKISRSSPAYKLLYLLGLFSDKQSTIPHDHVYGILGLLDDHLPEYLKPDYKLPFERVCQNYARFIIEATQNLRIIEAHTSELDSCPSWVPDFRYLTDIREYNGVSTKSAVRFSADGQQLTVEGKPMGRVLDCSCHHPILDTAVGNLRLINDFILMGSTRLTQRPLEAVFTAWLETMLDWKFMIPLQSVSGIRSMDSLIADHDITVSKLGPGSGKLVPSMEKLDDVAATIEVVQVVFYLTSFHYCLLENGDITICKLKKSEPQTRHHEGDAVWALKGCKKLSILRPEEGGYTYAGFCVPLLLGTPQLGRGSSYQLDEEFLADKQLEEVTLV